MKKKLAVLTLALSAAMMLSFGAFAEATDDSHSGNDDTLVVHTHEGCMAGTPVYEETKDPTCTSDGYILRRYKCLQPEEGTEIHEDFTVLPALGHTWASEQGFAEWGRMTVAPTCTAPGTAIDYCLTCGEEREVYRNIDKLDHLFETQVIDVETNCDHAGKYHMVCDFCGTPEVDEKGNIIYTEIPRDYDYHNKHPELFDSWITEVEPTCVKDGQKIRFCTVCGAKQIDTIPALGHDYVQSYKRVIDCYTAELTWKCTRCKDQYTEEVPVVSHVFKYTDDYIVEDESKAPTCEEDGYTVYKCVYYDEVDGHEGDETAKVKIPNLKLGHDWSPWVQRYGVNEQGNKYGYWLHTCQRCGKVEEFVGQNPPEGYGKNGWVAVGDKVSFYEKDILQKDMTGIYEYNGGMFFVTDGTIDNGANGLNLFDGTWYFLANGQFQSAYDGFAEYDGHWFMIENGMLDESANGLYDYNGGKFMFAAGKLRNDVSGLWQNPVDGEWYYLADGQVVSHTGVVEYDGAFFYVVNGKLASGMNGTVKYDGETFEVVAGQLY